MEQRRTEFIERTARYWGYTPEQTLALLRIKQRKSIRINSNRSDELIKQKIKELNINLKAIKGLKNCYKTDSLFQPNKIDLVQNDDIVLQNASSFCPVLNLNPMEKEQILDMCAAPGLKTSHISDLANNAADITANELSYSRYKKMTSFFSSYGCRINSINSDGQLLGRNTEFLEQFDKVMVDAPCSGEANIEIDKLNSFNTWSVKNIKRLQLLQLRLLKAAYKVTKIGGVIVYSTCTINAEENEIVVSKFLKNYKCRLEKVDSVNLPTIKVQDQKVKDVVSQEIIDNCARILPSINNEAFFVAKFVKLQEDEFFYS